MSAKKEPISLLFVCLGNICRSPAAAACFEKLAQERGVAEQFYVESCGLNSTFIGSTPDRRMTLAAAKRDIIMTSKARQIQLSDFDRFDYILAVNRDILAALQNLDGSIEHRAKLYLLCHFSAKYPEQDIPDPYFRPETAFDHVLDMTWDAAEGLLSSLT